MPWSGALVAGSRPRWHAQSRPGLNNGDCESAIADNASRTLVSNCSYSFENRRGRYAFRDRVVVPLGFAPVVLTSPVRMPLLPDIPCTRS